MSTSLFRRLAVPGRLAVLVEGESLVNDGTAAVCYTIAVGLIVGTESVTAFTAIDAVYLIGGGVIVGGVIGLTCAMTMPRSDDAMLALTLTTLSAYGSFVAVEQVHASGVIATVTAGLVAGTQGARARLTPSTRLAATVFWDYVAFAFNSVVFLLMGFQVRASVLLASWKPIVAAYIVVTAVRALVVFGVVAMRPRAERLPASWSAVITWGGIRGALSMVLALSIPAVVPGRDFLVTLTYGVVALSILVQGLTITPLLKWLGLGSSPHEA